MYIDYLIAVYDLSKVICLKEKSQSRFSTVISVTLAFANIS